LEEWFKITDPIAGFSDSGDLYYRE
jgi:hypothetical protein